MAFADTAMVLANLAANKGYRPMTTVDQTTHFMRARDRPPMCWPMPEWSGSAAP